MIDARRGKKAREADGESPTSADARPSLLRRIALGRRLHELGVTADQVTAAGIVLAAVTGVVIAAGHLWTGVALVTTGGLMDTLDGAVAKAAGSSSKRGAFLDSVSDRVADGLIFGGVAWYLAVRHTPELALLPFAILAVGNVISYERAKAELMGWVGKGGLMERAERLILLGVALGFNMVLVPILWVLLGLCVVTAVQRFVKIWGQATAELRGEPVGARSAARAGGTLAAWRPARVESRWRAWREARALGERPARRPVPSSRPRARRRQGEPLSTRVRSVLGAERAGVAPGRVTTQRLRRRREQGAAAAMRRRFGQSR